MTPKPSPTALGNWLHSGNCSAATGALVSGHGETRRYSGAAGARRRQRHSLPPRAAWVWRRLRRRRCVLCNFRLSDHPKAIRGPSRASAPQLAPLLGCPGQAPAAQRLDGAALRGHRGNDLAAVLSCPRDWTRRSCRSVLRFERAIRPISDRLLSQRGPRQPRKAFLVALGGRAVLFRFAARHRGRGAGAAPQAARGQSPVVGDRRLFVRLGAALDSHQPTERFLPHPKPYVAVRSWRAAGA